MGTESLGWSYIEIRYWDLKAKLRELRSLVKQEDDLTDDGFEDNYHITTKYGFTFDDASVFEKQIKNCSEGEVVFGKTKIFENEDYDVLHVDVKSEDLQELWAELSKLPNKDDRDEFNPHVTIAYLKPGTGKKYIGNRLMDGETMNYKNLFFENSCEVTTEFLLKSKSEDWTFEIDNND